MPPVPGKNPSVRRAFAGLSLWGVCLMSLSFAAGGDTLALPAGLVIDARATLGGGEGKLTVGPDGQTKIELKATALGDYAENWKFPAAVLDYLLPTPQPLPAECSRLALSVNCGYDENKHPPAMFRVIIRDARGGLWAVATRLRGGGSKLPWTQGYETIETYPWDASEVGRIDRWVMMSLEPQKFDEYDAPRPPLALAGFRLILEKEKPFAFALGEIRSVARGSQPNPYWVLNTGGERLHNEREGAWEIQRSGQGPDQPAPYLKASDLRLSNGRNEYTWEILAADEWTPVAGGRGELTVTDKTAPAVAFPLLPNGTYRLRLYVRHVDQPAGRSFFFHYVMIRNSRGEALAETIPAKPLTFSTSAGGNLFAAAEGAQATVGCAPDATAGASIAWKLLTADGRELAGATAPAEAGARVGLTPHFAAETCLWLKAELQREGKTVDQAWRLLGRPAAPVQPVAADPAAANAKLAPLAGKFQRTKGDWHEGGTDIAVKHAETMEKMAGWLDEAKEIGYNIVELSAPWFDLNPLPGVYQFSYLDKLVEASKQRGFYVVLRVHPNNGVTPGWVKRTFQADQNGLVEGVWHGGPNLLLTVASTEMVEAQKTYLRALAAHYRADPQVIGYTLSNVYFDHSLVDSPWLGEITDYSDAMRRSFVAGLREKYRTLAALSAAHGRTYSSWEAVELPRPNVAVDEMGRVRPRPDRLWLDFAAHKTELMLAFRRDAISALRESDPACAVGPYSDSVRAFLEHYYTAHGIFVAQGSMEEQYPPEPLSYRVRYEPHAKVTRGALVTDVGVSNLLFHRPGWNEFFNYWFPQWRIAETEPPIRGAEMRLKQWFAAADRLAGAQEFAAADQPATARGLMLHSLETLIYSWQHMHTSRVDDYVKPYRHQAKIEKVGLDDLFSPALTAEALQGRPYVYVPYSSDALTAEQRKLFKTYVEAGGRLILEASSGCWEPGNDTTNRLGAEFGLPEAKPTAAPADVTSQSFTAAPGGLLAGLKLAFRVRNWQPPIDDQPEPWIDTAVRNYYRPYALSAAAPAGATVVAERDGQPAALLVKAGRGEVLCFVGVVDWFDSPGLALRLANWGCGRPLDAQPPEAPELLASPMTQGEKLYVLGRRFVRHDLIAKLKQGQTTPEVETAEAMTVLFPQAQTGRYRVTDILNGTELGVQAAEALRTAGVKVSLKRGQAFVLEAVPEK